MSADPNTFDYWSSGELLPEVRGKVGTTNFDYWSAGELFPAAISEGTITGTATLNLSGLSISATGEETFSGTANLNLAGLSITATGEEQFSGTADLIVAGLSITATGDQTLSGAASLTLGGISITATGEETLTGTANLNVAGLSITTPGTEVTGEAHFTVSGLTITSTGSVTTPLPAPKWERKSFEDHVDHSMGSAETAFGLTAVWIDSAQIQRTLSGTMNALSQFLPMQDAGSLGDYDAIFITRIGRFPSFGDARPAIGDVLVIESVTYRVEELIRDSVSYELRLKKAAFPQTVSVTAQPRKGFDEDMLAGLEAAESEFGTTATWIDRHLISRTITGTFNSSTQVLPMQDAGFLPRWDATFLASLNQFAAFGHMRPAIGEKLIIDESDYRIGDVVTDSVSVECHLRNA